jgi:type IV pilus assembly protein PilY1
MPGDLALLRNRANTASRPTSPGFENVPIGFLDRIYATDTGGNIWRVDVADANPAAWVITKLASVAEAPAAGQHAARNYRKFLFMPDVVYTNETDGTPYDAVLVGSGDREHPFDIIVRNRFYMFKDKKTTSYTISDVPLANQPTPPTGVIVDSTSSTHLFDVTSNCLQTCTGTALSDAQVGLAAARGWKLNLSGNPGEKVVSPATTAAGTVIFNTNEPKDDGTSGTTSICTSSLGTARQYGINFQNATAANIFSNLPAQYVPAGGRFALFAGGGFLPAPVPVVVKIGDKYYQTVVAGVQTTNPGGLKLQSRLRTYWFRQVE